MEFMKKPKWKFLLRLLSYVLVAAVTCCVTMLLFCRNSKLEELQSVIENRFVGEVDSTAMEDAAAAAMIASLGDRWSYYIPASEYASYMDGKSNSYVGVGITIIQREDGTGFDILQVEPGSSAQEAGILPGDILIEAEGQSVAGMDANGPGQIIRGKEGSEVSVTVLRDGNRMTFTLIRRRIETQVATGRMLPDHVGYIQIKNFNSNCASHTIAAIEDLMEQGAAALVFDVRNNPGGYVTELVEVLDYLLPKGLLFRSIREGIPTEYHSDSSCIELPMAVLVNSESYSAAEFFAAALEEYHWATVVGDPTCGKSYFQNTIELRDGSAVGLSVGQYFTPNGVSLSEQGGLVPEITVEVEEETAALIYSGLLDPKEDPQVEAAVNAVKNGLTNP